MAVWCLAFDARLVEKEMIQMTIGGPNGQRIREICDCCRCHVRDLTVDDIVVKGNTDLIIRNSKGEEVTRKEHPHQTCLCDHCKH